MATLLIGANLPDVDVLSYAFGGGLTALTFRRGWTHGVAGLLVLPAVLTALIAVWGRVSRRPVDARQVVLLAAISIATHPLLDFMNTYGMRWLMPFGHRWYYGDALFIVDPWIWTALVVGIVLARGKRDGKYATGALAIVGLYTLAMLGASQWEERLIGRELQASGSQQPRVMVAPVPLNPLRRRVVIDDGDRYRFGTVNWLHRPAFALEPDEIPKGTESTPAQAASETREGRAFLSWARFPFFVVEPPGEMVHIVDARYTLDPNATFAAITIKLRR